MVSGLWETAIQSRRLSHLEALIGESDNGVNTLKNAGGRGGGSGWKEQYVLITFSLW